MFLLQYGGLNLGYNEILDMPIPTRRWYVNELLRQKKFEDEQIRDKGKPKHPTKPPAKT